MAITVGTVPVKLELIATDLKGISLASMELDVPITVSMTAADKSTVELTTEAFMPALAKAMRTWADEIDAEVAS